MACFANNLPGLWFSGVARNVPKPHSAHTIVSVDSTGPSSRRVPHARSLVLDVGSASQSSHLNGPSCASRQRGFQCASGSACHSRGAHNTTPVPLEVLLHFGLAETNCKLNSGVRMRIAWKETPNQQFWFRSASSGISKTRRLIGTSRRPSGVLLSGTKIVRLFQSRFSIRIR
jgi:hypothetical protein